MFNKATMAATDRAKWAGERGEEREQREADERRRGREGLRSLFVPCSKEWKRETKLGRHSGREREGEGVQAKVWVFIREQLIRDLARARRDAAISTSSSVSIRLFISSALLLCFVNVTSIQPHFKDILPSSFCPFIACRNFHYPTWVVPNNTPTRHSTPALKVY